MANDCLIEKLKGSVSGENNPEKYGIARIGMKYAASGTVDVSISTTGNLVKILGGTYNGLSEFTNSVNYIQFERNKIISDGTYGDGIIVFEFPKYVLSYLNGVSIYYADELEYSPLTYLKCIENSHIYNASALSKVIDKTTLTGFIISNGTVFDSPIDLTELGAGGALTLFQISGTNYIGSLDKIAMSPLTMDGCSFPDTKNVSFRVENFVAYRKEAGETTGTITTLHYIGACNATIFGHTIGLRDSNTISWDANSITVNGTTYDNNGNVVS